MVHPSGTGSRRWYQTKGRKTVVVVVVVVLVVVVAMLNSQNDYKFPMTFLLLLGIMVLLTLMACNSTLVLCRPKVTIEHY